VLAPPAPDVTGLLLAWTDGDPTALDQLMPQVYPELRRLAHRYMRGERPGHPLQTTALIHEAYLRLVDARRVRWQNRTHFFAVSAQVMRRILVDMARARQARRRGGTAAHISLRDGLAGFRARGPDLLALDEALSALASVDPRKEQVVELRYFGGLTVEETAEVLKVSPDTVARDWRMAKLWLLRQLRPATAQEQKGRR
jgi:RNA polymerase sigma-70 factor (ECF subfamily)